MMTALYWTILLAATVLQGVGAFGVLAGAVVLVNAEEIHGQMPVGTLRAIAALATIGSLGLFLFGAAAIGQHLGMSR